MPDGELWQPAPNRNLAHSEAIFHLMTRRIKLLPNSLMYVMRFAWQAREPHTISEIHEGINRERSTDFSKPLSFSAVCKAVDDLLALNLLTKIKKQFAVAVYEANVTREEYAASALNSVSEQILGVRLTEVFPGLIGQSEHPTGSIQSGYSDSESVAALLKAITTIDSRTAGTIQNE